MVYIEYIFIINEIKEVKKMPNLDGTGPLGKGPRTGRRGVGVSRRPMGSGVCTCPKCGKETPHKRGVPCSQVSCPKCQALMRGINCI